MSILILRSSAAAGGGGGSAPSWVASLAEFPTWTQLAKGTGAGFDSGGKLTTIIQSPNSSNPPGGWGNANAVFNSYTGASVSQTRKEYLLVANGGHGDGANNSVYGLALGDEIPGWRRLTDCTPDSQLGDLDAESGGVFLDGRTRAMHNTNQVWVGGTGITERVWMPMQSSVTSGQGGHADHVLSFDRGSLGAALTPLAWTGANIGPWTFWGSSNQNTNTYGFGAGLFDSPRNQVIAVSCAGGSFGIWWQKIPVTGGSEGVSTAYNDTSIDVNVCWAQICPDLGIVVAGDSDFDRVCVLDIVANTWSAPAQSGTPYTPFTGGNYVGSVYIPASRHILIADPKSTGSTYYKVAIPMSGSSYNQSGTWVWSSNTWTGGPTIAAGDYANDSGATSEFTSSKLNKVSDMGDGTSILVLGTNINRPTYVSKIPAAGI